MEHSELVARSQEHLCSALESLLFAAGRPLLKAELRRVLGVAAERLDAALAALDQACQGRGVRVQQNGEEVQLVTAPENARFVAALLGLPASARLTAAALETLAVVAYRQPVTRGQLERIRGANSDRALASLVAHGLVEEIGRAATVGRPTLFGTTLAFLEQFGLTDLAALPAAPIARFAAEDAEGRSGGEESSCDRTVKVL
jgi:segregation and condensation protein B